MAVTLMNGSVAFTNLTHYRHRFVMLTSAGSGVTGLTSGTLGIWRSRRGETAVSISGARTITQISSGSMPGVYEIALTTADLDTAGPLTLYFAAAGAEPTILNVTILPRQAVLVG